MHLLGGDFYTILHCWPCFMVFSAAAIGENVKLLIAWNYLTVLLINGMAWQPNRILVSFVTILSKSMLGGAGNLLYSIINTLVCEIGNELFWLRILASQTGRHGQNTSTPKITSPSVKKEHGCQTRELTHKLISLSLGSQFWLTSSQTCFLVNSVSQTWTNSWVWSQVTSLN